MRKPAHILIASWLAVAVLAAGVAVGASRQPPRPGSRARQLLLKQALEKRLSGTLVAELSHNKKVWGAMTPEQLRQLRERYYAFLRLDQDKQAELLRAMPEFERLTGAQREAYQQRAAWLKKVVGSLTPDQREELKAMTPSERAKRLLELKGRLVSSRPSTQPASPAE